MMMHPCSLHEITLACGKDKLLKMWKAHSTPHQCPQLNASKSDKCLYLTGTPLTCSPSRNHLPEQFFCSQAFWLGECD
jgi:hypothetical protein